MKIMVNNDYKNCEKCNNNEWELVWLSDDLEGFRCKICGNEEVDVYPDIYCQVCGACGIDECCHPWECTHKKGCLYPEYNNNLYVKFRRLFYKTEFRIKLYLLKRKYKQKQNFIPKRRIK